MIVDTSGLMAILRAEDDAECIIEALGRADHVRMSAGTWIELAAVTSGKGDEHLSVLLDRLVATARTPRALARLRDLLAGRAKFVGTEVRQPTRWAIVRRLITVGAPDAATLFAAEQRLDRSSEAVKDAFVAYAATPDRSVKASYFSRYFDDAALNEAWASESLGAFNTIEQAPLTLPFLRPALDRLEWIRQNRRIFFLPAWIDAFIGGQRDPAALQVVDQFLDAHPALPIDVRRKVLTARDELALTVRIRAATLEGKASSIE